jgi:hypothetical protein
MNFVFPGHIFITNKQQTTNKQTTNKQTTATATTFVVVGATVGVGRWPGWP